MNIDLDAKLVLSNKLVDDLKCENEFLKIHAKCLITESIAKKEENLCCNHVVVLDFVLIMSSTSKDKSVYIPPHKRNQKVERKALKPKSLFRSHPRELCGSKQGFETRTGPYGPTGKTVNLLQSRFYKLKNRSLPKKQEAVRTAVQPRGSTARF